MKSKLGGLPSQQSASKGTKVTLKYLVGILVLLLSMTGPACQEEIQKVRITAEEFLFLPKVVHLQAWKPFHLVVANQGRELHRFKSSLLTHQDVRVQWKSEQMTFQEEKGISLPPGYAIELVIKPPTGFYRFQCPIRGHRGMQGMFIVEEAGNENLDRAGRT